MQQDCWLYVIQVARQVQEQEEKQCASVDVWVRQCGLHPPSASVASSCRSVGQRARESNLRSTPARDSPDIPAYTRSVSMSKAAYTRSVSMSKAASDSPSVSVRRVESDTYLPGLQLTTTGKAASDSPDMYVFHVGTDTSSSVTVLQVPTAHLSQMTTHSSSTYASDKLTPSDPPVLARVTDEAPSSVTVLQVLTHVSQMTAHSSSTYASDKLTPSDLPVLARVSPTASPSISHSRSLSIGKGASDSPPVSLRHVGTDAPMPFQQVTTGKSSSHSPSHSRSSSRLSQVLRPDSNRASPILSRRVVERTAMRGSSPAIDNRRVSTAQVSGSSPLTPTRSLERTAMRGSSPAIDNRRVSTALVSGSSPLTPTRSLERTAMRGSSPAIDNRRVSTALVSGSSPLTPTRSLERTAMRGSSPAIDNRRVSTALVSGSNSARVSPLIPTRSLVAEVAIGPSGRAPRSQANASSRSMNHLSTVPRPQSNATNSTSYNQLSRLRSQSKATNSESSGHMPEIDAADPTPRASLYDGMDDPVV
eukprot:g31495.t1